MPENPATAPLGKRWFGASVLVAFLLTFLQAPGLTAADTKYDLAQNPLGFLGRAAHLWSSQAPMGQVQNQAYGYFFPHGAFFALGDILGLPAWVTQRIWWALLLLAGFWGLIRLCQTLGIGTRGSRIVAALTFALAPRVLTTLGSISSETLPMMLAPWVLLAPAALSTAAKRRRRGGAESPAGSALALALMGSVNAVATAAAFLPALLWLIALRPNRRWWRFTAAWIPLLVLATFWWVVPLLLLGEVSPPFLDYIESSGVTTQWASLAEVLRGTDSWTPFVSPERIAGAVLVTQPAAVLATGLLAAAGMAGLAMRSMPYRGRLALILCVGLVGICAGYVGELSGPFAESVRLFLDSAGAPLRNVHKLEPLIRLPLVLGLAQLLAKVPLPASVPMPVWRSALAHPERNKIVAVGALVLTALVLSTSLAWTGKLAPRGAYDRVPGYWQQTADWLHDNASDTRALVVPGAPFGSQRWGLTRDEPLQALARTPWAVRDAVPLNPPGTIRAMDSVQRLIADGRPSDGLAATLAGQGIGVLVLRNDLDPVTSRSTRPLLAHQAIEGSPGLTEVAEFGGPVESSVLGKGLVADGDLRPGYPAVQIYRVETPTPGTPTEVATGTGAPPSFPGAYRVPLNSVPTVQGGPEALERLHRDNPEAATPALLAADAAKAGLPTGGVTVTDTPMDRESDFGRVDNHASALRAPQDARRTRNLVPDYPVAGTGLVTGEWSGARITASSSAADSTQLGGSAPGNSTAAVVDGDQATAWISNGAEHALGQWLRLDLDTPITVGQLSFRTTAAAMGDPVKWVEVRTANGTVSTQITKPGALASVSLPPGRTDWLTITAIRTEGGTAGGQFGISELAVEDYAVHDAPTKLDIRHRTVLPPVAAGTRPRGWDLGQEFPGRNACFDAPDRVRCAKGLALGPEELSTFERTLSVPELASVTPQLTVRPRQGPALERLLTDPARPVAHGAADVGELRGAAPAVTDGDPRTSWVAPQDSVLPPNTGEKPTLTLDLPEPTTVTGLELTPPLGPIPGAPTSVTVNLGDGPQVRALDRGEPGKPVRIPLHPRVTDRIELSLRTWKPVLDRTEIGFTVAQPPGLAEVSVLGPDYPPPAADREITVGCDQGPTIDIGGQTVRAAVTATAEQFRSGAPLPARICANGALPETEPTSAVTPTDAPGTGAVGASAGNPHGATTTDSDTDSAPDVDGAFDAETTSDTGSADNVAADPTDANDQERAGENGETLLAPGRVDVTVTPTELFFVDRLRLDRTDFGAPAATPPPDQAVGPDLLVLPLSNNVGWRATTSDGRALDPVVVNGWQQAWVVPENTTGPITVSFPADRWYRLSIFGGLLLLIPLALLAIPRTGRRRTERTERTEDRATEAASSDNDTQRDDPPPTDTAHPPVEDHSHPPSPAGKRAAPDSSVPNPGDDSHLSSATEIPTTPDSSGEPVGERTRPQGASEGYGLTSTTDDHCHPPDVSRERETASSFTSADLGNPHNTATPRRGEPHSQCTEHPTWAPRWLGALGLVATATVIAGAAGAAIAIIGLLAAHFAPRIAPTALVATAGIGTALSAAALSTGPWRSPDGYMGGSLYTQLPALIAITATTIAALPRRRATK
ncbi:alpha-(1-_3)-arabinofuranosyltransferase domain-containing protein [Nocardia callitridis]|uniref:Alpha-(1->3)-arabinofuranosyltransferase family protein n=1 Tax=Nocardia callitridis TaxID=648753 RepID=A0ABP9K1I5_9NOCA